jgi:hypothetical protein
MSSTKELTEYEKDQITAIKKWKQEEPSVVSKAIGVITYPVIWLIQKIIPKTAIQGALDGANWAASHMADTGDIKRDGSVEKIPELKVKDLELSDKLANSVHNWAIGIATAEGGVTGATGLPGLAADVPSIITLALRTIHKIGLCYGYECTNEMDKNFILGILSASGANSMKEKLGALTTLRSIEVTIAKKTWKAMAEKAASKQLSKEGGIIAVQRLAKQLGINLTKRKALQAIPFIGLGVGATVNGWYIKDVGWTARRAFQERWLIDNEKVFEI